MFRVLLQYYFWSTLLLTAPCASGHSPVQRGQASGLLRRRSEAPGATVSPTWCRGPESAQSSDRGPSSPKFTARVEKRHPRHLIISARELPLQRPDILNSNFNIYIGQHEPKGKKTLVIAKRRNKLNPQK